MALGVPAGSDDKQFSAGLASPSNRKAVSIDIETIRLQLSSLAGRLQSRVRLDTLRPLPMFLGVNPDLGFCLSAGAFTPPVKKVDKSTLEKIKSRVKLNFAFFLTNYVLVAAMTAIVIALMHPGMLFFVGVIYGLWSLHSFLIRNELIVFGIRIHALMTVQQRFYLLFVLTTLVTIWKCLIPALTFLLISSIIILSHALLRDPKHIETTSDLLGSEEEEYESVENDEGAESGGSNGSGILVERPKPKGDVI